MPSVTHSAPKLLVPAQTPRYAIIKFANAIIESNPAHGYLLVKKFAFGWQPIDLSDGAVFRLCDLSRHGIPDADLSKLKHATDIKTGCPISDQRDVGSEQDIEAVRKFMAGKNEIVPFVRIAKGYAFLEWWGWGGGENFYKKTRNGWKLITGGGGAIRAFELQRYGVPLAVATELLKPW